VPSGSGVFLRLLVGELGTPKLAQIFAYGKWLYPYRMQLHGASDLDHRCPKTRNSADECTFPCTKYLPPTPKITPKPHFGGPFNAKPIIQIDLRKSHVNGAMKVKLYSYILYRYRQVLGCQNFFARCGKVLILGTIFPARWRPGGAGPPNVNLGPPDISETTTARKLNLKIPLDMVKYPLWVQKLLHYRTQHEGGCHTEFRQMSISPRQTTAKNCKTAFSLHVVESASDDYSF